MTSTASATEELTTLANKKITSFNLPTKRSNDFNKFAHNSMFADNNYTKDSSNKKLTHPSLVSTGNVPSYSNSINDETSSIAYTDDEKLMSSNQLNFLDGQMTRSFPEFQQSKYFFNFFCVCTLRLNEINNKLDTNILNKNIAQRKRSYEVQPINSNEGRRHSMARFNSQNVEAPIRRVINILCLAHEKSNTDIVKLNLDMALDILRTTELYSPSLVENDKHTSDLVSGLMSVSI